MRKKKINKGGRPKGTTKVRLNIYAEQFYIIINYINNCNRKKWTKHNAIKAFFLLYYFGFRQGELTLLIVKDIKDMVRFRKISLRNNTKTKKAREAYISENHVKILEKVFEKELQEDDRFAVIKPWDSPMEQYRPSSLNFLLNSIIMSALGEQYSTHSFRAGYITQLDEAGYTLPMLQSLIGHKSPATTARYITVSEERKREAIEKIRTVKV